MPFTWCQTPSAPVIGKNQTLVRLKHKRINIIQNPEDLQNPFLLNRSNDDPSKPIGRIFINTKHKKKTTIEKTTGDTISRSRPNVIKINNKKHFMPKPNSTISAFRSPTGKLSPK
tara:strand:+ start:1066 stop:1410 length:345 start_codon:yes stop_codon:yes gene_type:complete